jgi:Fe2+ transport system protein FeoA
MHITSLSDAPFGKSLMLVKVENANLEMRLRQMGLFEGSLLTRLDEEAAIHPVRVQGPRGEFILGGGMASRVIVHKDNGARLPLTELKAGERGHIEGIVSGDALAKTLKILGAEENDEIIFVREIPPMEYITVVEKGGRIRLNEGMAAKIWGRVKEAHRQFACIGVGEPFEVADILGGKNAGEMLSRQGIVPGKMLMLESVEPAKILFMTRQNPVPVIISTPDGLRLFLQKKEGGQIFVSEK